MDSDFDTSKITSSDQNDAKGPPQLTSGKVAKNGPKAWMFILGAIVLVGLLVGIIVLLMSAGSENVGKIRDIFLIFMALESLIIGIVLVILIVQLAILINLIQNEIKPILESTNETVNTLKGTTVFLSENLTEPVIKLNEFLAGLSKFFQIIFPNRK